MAYGGGKSAVDAILAEAADLVALEQIARLNTAHLDDSAALPSSLESRFRKLKSLPTAAAPPPAKSLGRSVTAPPQHRDDPPADSSPQANPPAPAPEAARKDDQTSPPQPPPNPTIPAVREEDEDEEEDLERLFGPRRGRPTLKERNRRTDSSSSRSPPPPRQACCFPFSPKKTLQRTPATRSSKKKTHAEGYTDDVLGVDAGEWGDENRRMATELKEQQRRMKKALEEQVKVSRETAKMARWVKQASARMTHTDAIDDLLSDLDDEDELK